jgi:hypothetical protein
LNFKIFFDCAKQLPADISVLIRGDHGIGKSQSVYQLASHFGLPMVERRLSQMSEGDMIGLPKLDDKVTKFMPPDWYMKACTEPVCLFLDELNRATPEVMQAAFQIVLDRTLNGHKLHEGTRVYAAINTNGKYQVNEMDPALLDRFWATDLEPVDEDWFAWASTEVTRKDASGKEVKGTRINRVLIDFIKKHPKVLWTGKVENGDVAPSPRSWDRLDHIYRTAGNLMDQDVQGNRELEQTIYSLAVGMVGLETARSLVDYVKTLDRQVTALDILDNFEKNKAKIEGLGQEKWNICIDKIAEYVKDKLITKKQSENLGKFVGILPDELVIHIWTCVVNTTNSSDVRDKNISTMKGDIVPHIIRVTAPTVESMKQQLEQKK